MRVTPTLLSCLPLFTFTVGLTIPPDLLSLQPRSQQHCENAPATIAGSMLSRRSSSTTTLAPSLDTRTDFNPSTIVWCRRDSRTYIIVTMVRVFGGLAASQPVSALLTGCMNIIAYEIEQNHDGPIDGGTFSRTSQTAALSLQAWNFNNHQVTYGVLGAALSALADFMQQKGWGACRFSIHDGPIMVGVGQIAVGHST